jgi:hypothetical protein
LTTAVFISAVVSDFRIGLSLKKSKNENQPYHFQFSIIADRGKQSEGANNNNSPEAYYNSRRH